MTIKQMRSYLRQRYNGMYNGTHVDDMSNNQVIAIYYTIINRKESDRCVCIVRTSPKIIRRDGRVYMLKDNGRFEEIENDYDEE